MPQVGFSVEEGFLLANLDQRGISRGSHVPATYDQASEYVSDIMRNIAENGFINMENVSAGGKYRFGDGSVSAPAVSWAGDTDTGRYRIAAGNPGESVDGVKAYDWTGTRFRFSALDLDWLTDNAEDIGADGLNRPRSIYAGTDVDIGGNYLWKSGTAFKGTLDHAHTAARTHTYPDATGTLVQYTVPAATGDLLYWAGGPNWTRLAVGGASTLLKSDGTNPAWGTVNLLSAFHGDTTAGAVARGDLVVGQGVAAKWQRLALGAAARVLRSDGTDAVWAQVNLTTDVTGALPIANGGTGGTTAAAARTNLDVPSNAEAILDTIVDAKGDLIVATAADTVARLAVGTNDQVLVADSAQVAGVKWAAVADGSAREGIFQARLVLTDAVGGTTVGLRVTDSFQGRNIEINGSLIDIVATAYDLLWSDNLITATGADSGAAGAASTLYYVYASSASASPFPSDLRLSATAPSTFRGARYLGTTGNAAQWRFVGWIRFSSTTRFVDDTTDRLVVSQYNQVRKSILLTPGYVDDNAITTYTLSSDTWVALNAGTGATASFISDGINAVEVDVAFFVTPGGGSAAAIGIGVDTSTGARVATFSEANATTFTASRPWSQILGEGYHTLVMVGEIDGASAATVRADQFRSGGAADPYVTYLVGTVMV